MGDKGRDKEIHDIKLTLNIITNKIEGLEKRFLDMKDIFVDILLFFA